MNDPNPDTTVAGGDAVISYSATGSVPPPVTPPVAPISTSSPPPPPIRPVHKRRVASADEPLPSWNDILKLVVFKLVSRKFWIAVGLIAFNIGSYAAGQTWQQLIGNPANLAGLIYIITQGVVDAMPASTEKMRAFFGR